MTKVLRFSRLEISPSGENNFLFQNQNKFQVPSLPIRHEQNKNKNRKSRIHVSVEAKGKRNPKLVCRKISVKVNLKQVKTVLLRQIFSEEKSCLKSTGVAVFYAELLKSFSNSNNSNLSSCPICQSSQKNLLKKLQNDTKYLLNFTAKTLTFKKKNKLINSLAPHDNFQNSNQELCAFSHLATSDCLLLTLQNWLCGTSKISNSFWKDLTFMTEIKLGKRDALRLLKLKLMDSKKCGVCNCNISSENVSKVLSTIDKILQSLNF